MFRHKTYGALHRGSGAGGEQSAPMRVKKNRYSMALLRFVYAQKTKYKISFVNTKKIRAG